MASTPPSNDDVSVARQLQKRSLEERLFGEAEPVRVGRFTLLEALGTGGMGAVYAAYDPSLDRRVAVKVLRTRAATDEANATRMVREAKALARLAHRSVITVHEVGVDRGRVFIAMEYAPGGTLAEWAQRKQGEPTRFMEIVARMRECIEGLQAAHDAGLIHRDFKPGNVLITADGQAKIADFGLARVGASEAGPAVLPPTNDAAEDLTRTGSVIGTPAYMAPEQFDGAATEKTDQFSLCATFFEVFYGARAYPGRSTGEIMERMQRGELERPAAGDVPGWMFDVLAQGLSVDPDQRHASLRVLGAAIERSVRPGRSWALPAAVVGVGGAVVAVGLWPDDAAPEGEAASPCLDGAAELEAAWGDGRQSAIRSAFEATEQPAWPGLWERVQTRFDAWAKQWREATLSSCEATRVHGSQTPELHELRALCLERHRRAFEALSDTYVEVDAASVYATSESSLWLPKIAECADRSALSFGDGVDLSTPEVQEFYEHFDAGRALHMQHRDAEAESHVLRAAEVAEAAELHRPAASSYRTLAALARRHGRYDEATQRAERALHHAERAGDGAEIVWAWLELARSAEATDRSADADFLVERARSNAEGHRVSTEVQLSIVELEAHLQMRAGKTAEAAQMLLDAADTAERLGLDRTNVATNLSDAAGPLALAGDGKSAEAVARRSIAIADELFGPTHYVTLGGHLQLAQLYEKLGRYEDALAESSLFAENLPPPGAVQERLRAEGLGLHATTLFRAGRSDEAVALLKKVITDSSRRLGPDSVHVLSNRERYGTMLLEVGRLDEALTEHEALAEASEKNPAQLPVQRGIQRLNHAEVLSKLGRHPEAVAKLADAMLLLREVLGADSPYLFGAVLIAAEVEMRASHAGRARALLLECLEIAKKAGIDPAQVEKVETHLATLREGGTE